MTTNHDLLTRGDEVFAKKKAYGKRRLEEITFDPELRKDYLTGFRKRKLERKRKGQQHAKELERKERIEERRRLREERKDLAERKTEEVNAAINRMKDNDLETEAERFDPGEVQESDDVERQDLYDDVNTKVIITEDFTFGEESESEAPHASINAPKPKANAKANPNTKTPRRHNRIKKSAARGTNAERRTTASKPAHQKHKKPHTR